MKRRIIAFILAVSMIMLIPLSVSASEVNTYSEEVVWFEDGSSLVITILVNNSRTSGTKSGTKQYTYRDSNGDLSWIAQLNGTFTYNGTTSTCTASSCNVTIYDSSWYNISKSASKSGNTATATVTMGLKVLGVTISKPTHNLTLTCDKDGNLS